MSRIRKNARTLKKLNDISHNQDAVLIFQDEVHYQAQTTITRMWAPVGSEPKVRSLPGRDKVSYSGFVNPSQGQLFVTKPSWFDFETTIAAIRAFIESCPPPSGKKYYLVMDNAPWHKKAKGLIKENADHQYDDINEKVVFVYLPPYSPDLNPIEQVWRKTRREVTHNRFFADIHQLEDTVDQYYKQFSATNEELKSLCSFNFFNDSSCAEGTLVA